MLKRCIYTSRSVCQVHATLCNESWGKFCSSDRTGHGGRCICDSVIMIDGCIDLIKPGKMVSNHKNTNSFAQVWASCNDLRQTVFFYEILKYQMLV